MTTLLIYLVLYLLIGFFFVYWSQTHPQSFSNFMMKSLIVIREYKVLRDNKELKAIEKLPEVERVPLKNELLKKIKEQASKETEENSEKKAQEFVEEGNIIKPLIMILTFWPMIIFIFFMAIFIESLLKK